MWERTVLGFPHKGGDCAGQEIRGQKEVGTPTSAVPAETWGVRHPEKPQKPIGCLKWSSDV